MRRNPLMFSIIIISIILIVDAYAFKGLKQLLQNTPLKIKYLWYTLYWTLTVMLLIWFGLLMYYQPLWVKSNKFYYVWYFIGAFMLIYLPKLTFISFHLLEDIVKLVTKLFAMPFSDTSVVAQTSEKMSRSSFLTKMGLVLSAIPFAAVAWGITRGKFNWTVNNLKMKFPNLPDGFVGLKILQISDIHIGSFSPSGKDEVREGIEKINEQNADIVVFTGDLVNNVTAEIDDEWVDIFSKIKAKVGKYSILGNHDYGDYWQWENAEAKQENLRQIEVRHEQMGFKLLKNANVKMKSGNDEIAIIGVENWGLPPFPQYGKLSKALEGCENTAFKVLLSHDPTHWDEEVAGKTNIDLTLSGHTHGMQFIIKVGNLNWSPIKWKYKRWEGLHKHDNQYLYINIGFGYIAFPGRVGAPPDITVFELTK